MQVALAYAYAAVVRIVFLQPHKFVVYNVSTHTEIAMRVVFVLFSDDNNVCVGDTSWRARDQRRQILRQVDDIATIAELTTPWQMHAGHHRDDMCYAELNMQDRWLL